MNAWRKPSKKGQRPETNEKDTGRWSGRAVWTAVGVTVLLTLLGTSFANTLNVNPLSQQASDYSVSAAADVNFPTAPQLSISTVGPLQQQACATPTNDGNGGYVMPQLTEQEGYDAVAIGVTGTCVQGDVDELFTFASAQDLTGEVMTISVQTTFTGSTGTAQSVAVDVSLTIVAGTGQGDTVYVAVDYGTGGLPAGGIGSLDILLT